MADYTITIIGPDHTETLAAGGNRTLLELIQLSGNDIHASCGGNGTCRQCTVTATGPLLGLDGAEKNAQEEEILACRWYPAGPVTLVLPDTGGEEEHIAADRREIPGGGHGLGLSVDIGTTTVAAYLYDLSMGHCLGTACGMNAQRSFGDDVISRIHHCAQSGGLEALTAAIRNQILELIHELTPEPERITCVSIAGNTVMEHIFAGLSPESIGVAPFTPLDLFGREFDAAAFLPGLAPGAVLYLAPCVAGYVGGDITAGLMSSGAWLSNETVLFLDIGTNGEMALGNGAEFLCCATAAGPAFEGAGIECGSPARDGAIDAVASDLSYTTIGGGAPASICGSGLIDAVAALLKNELVDETGRLEGDRYEFGNGVYLSQQDIRQVQLAKAAIRAGIETLLDQTGTSYDDIRQVIIAGGFGFYMNVDSACAIGLLPAELRDRARCAGNTSGTGASMALSPLYRATLSQVTGRCRYVELSGSAVFNEKYVDAMLFGEEE